MEWAQVNLLTAIYHELRYGHDQAAEQAKLNIEVLSDHAVAMDTAAAAMRGHGDALDRANGSMDDLASQLSRHRF
jgi:hypothetical protein